jgi:hypothetical protein
MNNAQFQNLFDSVCRCFGHAGNGPGNGEPAATSLVRTGSANSLEQGHRTIEENHSHVGKRRTNRLGLQDEQWDELFEKKNKKRPPKPTSPVNDLTTAQALAQAKLAANPPRYNRSKRKRPEKAREEIFRSKDLPPEPRTAQSNQTPFSRLLHPSLAMCFATPIRGTEEEADDTRSVDNSETGTLNTCEDTITSTVYYESKLAHLTETRPPMPLFNQFKVGQKDEIRTVMTQDTHSSVNMIRLLQQQQQKAAAASATTSSEDGHRKSKTERPAQRYRNERASQLPTHQSVDEEMEDVLPDVKAVSDSSGSDGSIKHPSSRRKVYEA